MVRVLSRNLKELDTSFLELVAAGSVLPKDTLIDGEIVIPDATGASDFGALQKRLGTGRRDALKSASAEPAGRRRVCASLSQLPQRRSPAGLAPERLA